MNRKSLGKGLEALIPGAGRFGVRTVQEINVEAIRPNPSQPRRKMDHDTLDELTESVRLHGVLQPVLVQKSETGYELVAGERRWRAAINAGLKTIPVIVEEFSPEQKLEIALIENLQREDLNPVDLARGVKKLVDDFGLTQEEVAYRIGKKRPTISNLLRLLELPLEIQKSVESGELSPGHARALLGIAERENQLHLARKICKEKLSVREVERLIRNLRDATRKNGEQKTPTANTHQPSTKKEKSLQELLTSMLATRVKVGRRRIIIEYSGEEELQRIYATIVGREEPF